MRIIDRQFRHHPHHYVLQCLLAMAAIMIVLLFMNAVAYTALIAALGASAFIVFTMPDLNVAKPRFLVGGYIVGILVGVPLGMVRRWHWLTNLGMTESASLVLLGGLAVGLAIFLMVITNTEHPPAAGVALGLVVSTTWDVTTLAVILNAIIALSVLKWLLRPFLKNLL